MEPNLLSIPNAAALTKHFEDPNNIQVSDFKQPIETAENKCGTLKQHLEYMQMLFQDSADYLMNPEQNIPTISNYNEQEFNEKLNQMNKESNVGNIVDINNEKNQQEGNCSKKVKVIKNILTGINNTVDRISKLSTNEIQPKRTKRNGKSHSRESLKTNKYKSMDKLIPKNKNDTKRPSTIQKKNTNSQGTKVRKSHSNRTLCSLNNGILIKKYKEEYAKKYPNKIIEIYHNDALKLEGCHSDEQCIVNKPRLKNLRASRYTPKVYEDEIPKHETSPNSLIKHENEEKEPVKMTGHFLTPTFSSKQRQVDRSLFNENSKLSFNKIPFVAGMATTQSHNLGMNIQQVLSIIKLKQQLQQSDTQIRSEENIHAKSSDEQDKVSESKTLKNCSLNRQRNISNYEHILSNYIKNSTSLSFLKDDKVKRCSILNYQSSEMINNLYENDLESEALNIQYLKPKFYRNIKGRIRGIREVLNSLYADYLRLNRIYKRIYQEIVEEHYIDYKVLKSLELLEGELQAKEDEISVVMCLFKQVIELKEQVSTLRHQTMQMDLPISEQPDQEGSPSSLLLSNRRYKKNSTATVRLTRLLRTIQKFQNKLKYQDIL